MATGPEKVMSTGVCMNCMREGGGGGRRPARESTLKVFRRRGIRFSFWSRVMMGCKRVACSPCMACTWVAVTLEVIWDIIENIFALNISARAARVSATVERPAWREAGNWMGSSLSWGESIVVMPFGTIFSLPFMVPVWIMGGSTRSWAARRTERDIWLTIITANIASMAADRGYASEVSLQRAVVGTSSGSIPDSSRMHFSASST